MTTVGTQAQTTIMLTWHCTVDKAHVAVPLFVKEWAHETSHPYDDRLTTSREPLNEYVLKFTVHTMYMYAVSNDFTFFLCKIQPMSS